MTDDGTDARGTGPEDAEPLLVRPFLDGRTGAADTAPTWPAPAEPDPAPAAAPAPAPAARPAHRRPGRRRVLVVAGAAAAALLALGAAGVAAILPDDDGRRALPIPTGSLPPLPATTTAAPPAAPPTTVATDPPETTTATPSRTTTAPPATTPPTTRPSATVPPATVPTRTSRTVEAPFAAPPDAPRTGRITGPGGRCLDLDGGVTTDGNRIQVFDCNPTAAQVWTLTPDGTLQVLGKCANVGGDGGVHIVKCDGRSTAQWREGPDRTLINLAEEHCLTDPSGGTRAGTAVRALPCTGDAAQKWSLP